MYCMHALSKISKKHVQNPKKLKETENSMFFMLNMEFVSLMTTRFPIFLLTHNGRHPIAIGHLSVSGDLINSIFNIKTLNILYVFPIASSASNNPTLKLAVIKYISKCVSLYSKTHL